MEAIHSKTGEGRVVIPDGAPHEPKIVLSKQSLHCFLGVPFPVVVELSVTTVLCECLDKLSGIEETQLQLNILKKVICNPNSSKFQGIMTVNRKSNMENSIPDIRIQVH